MNKLSFTSLILILPTLGMAQILGPDQENKQPQFNKTFERLHSSATIHCSYYKRWGGHEGNVRRVEVQNQIFSKEDKKVSAHFKVGETDLKINITAGGENGLPSYTLGDTEIPVYLTKYNTLFFNQELLNDKHQALIKEYNLYELDCNLDMAKEANHIVENKELHIAMHPYRGYDLDGESNAVVQETLNRTDIDQLLLLDDDRNMRKASLTNFNEFLELGHVPHDVKIRYFSGSPIKVPENVPTKVAAGGHIKFKFTQPAHEISYTGGNYNFCILNSSRRLVHALFESSITKSLQINYLLDGVVVQKGSFVSGLRFNRKRKKYFTNKYLQPHASRSNLLGKIFRNMQADGNTLHIDYLNTHYNDFKNGILNMRKHQYGSVQLIRQGIGGTRSEMIQGTGVGEYQIIFNYI